MESFNLMAVRCRCGKAVGEYQFLYERFLREGYSIEQALDKLGMSRQCCRMEFLCPMIVPLGPERSYREREDVILSEEQGFIHRLTISGESTIQKLQEPSRNLPPSERIKALSLGRPKNIRLTNLPPSISGETKTSFVPPKMLSFEGQINRSTFPNPSLPASFTSTTSTQPTISSQPRGTIIPRINPPTKQIKVIVKKSKSEE